MITYAVEPWSEYKREAARMWVEHWEEIAINRDTIQLDVDYRRYDGLDATGQLHVVVAREAGQMIGYHLSIVQPHLHYAGTLHAFVDIYYIKPSHRKGRTGINLFKFVESSLKKRGVQKIITGTKRHMDMSRLFEHLGYSETEVQFTKYIGS